MRSGESAVVTSLEVLSLRLPFRFEFAHHLAARRESCPQVVRLTLSDGTVGYGEALPRPYLTGETEASVRGLLTGELAALAGAWHAGGLESATRLLETLEARAVRMQAPAAFCGLELAVLDAAGRREGRSVAGVLGPVRRRQVPYEAAVVGFMPLAALPLYLGRVRRMGKRVVKLKVGRVDDLERVRMARRALGESVELVLDANGAWSAEEAIARIRRLEPFGLAAVEQPVARHDLIGMARVRAAIHSPVVADESICTVADGERLLKEHACDLWNLRIGKCGGLLATLELVRMAADNGVGCSLGVLVGETGILASAGRLLAACVRELRYLEHDDSGMKPEDPARLSPVTAGRAWAPVDTPGLGVEMDHVRLEALSEARTAWMRSAEPARSSSTSSWSESVRAGE